MCNYQALFHNDNTGYVVRCLDCDKLQIGYGNIMLTLDRTGFGVFHDWLKKIKASQDNDIKENLRCITVPTPCEGVKLLLSLRELEEFESMLDDADTELKAGEMMELF